MQVEKRLFHHSTISEGSLFVLTALKVFTTEIRFAPKRKEPIVLANTSGNHNTVRIPIELRKESVQQQQQQQQRLPNSTTHFKLLEE